jgi:hypothetical protein
MNAAWSGVDTSSAFVRLPEAAVAPDALGSAFPILAGREPCAITVRAGSRVKPGVSLEPAIPIAPARYGLDPRELTAVCRAIAAAHRTLHEATRVGAPRRADDTKPSPLVQSATDAEARRFGRRDVLCATQRAALSDAQALAGRRSTLLAHLCAARVCGRDAAGRDAGVVPNAVRSSVACISETVGVPYHPRGFGWVRIMDGRRR